MTDGELLAKLWDYGHFRNPDFVNMHNVEKNDLPTLRVTDTAAQEAIKSYQAYFKETLDDLALKHHSRAESIVDGSAGPATQELVGMVRCGVPDFAGQQANWPVSCRGNLKTGYDMRMSGLDDATLLRAWQRALRNWNGALADVSLRYEVGSQAGIFDIFAKGAPLRGSTLAWSHLARNVCEVTLDQRYDTTITWAERMFVTTATHELGHALGCGHLGGSTATMTPMINSAARQRWGFPNSQDLALCRRLGYQVAANPTPEPEDPIPPDPPGDDGPVVGGVFTVKIDGKTYRYGLVSIDV